jgi:uncharacterized membrane protein
MSIAWTILLILFYFGMPVLILYVETHVPAIKKLSPVVICYILGVIVGNTGILPENVYPLQDIINTIVVPLAIPMLLFSMDIRRWFSMARSTFVSLILGVVSVVVMVLAGFFLLAPDIENLWQVSGMLIGVYTGGTPNLAAIAAALHVDANTYLMTHTYDLVIGALLLLFLLTIGKRFFLLFLRPFKASDGMNEQSQLSESELSDEFSSYQGIFKKRTILPLLAALGIAILIFGAMGGLSMLFSKDYQMAVVILGITTLAILASLIPRIKSIERTFQGGMYLILVFCLVVASMADIRTIFGDINWPLMTYIILAVPGSLLFHAFLSWIFKVDADNMIISSVALSMSPPFVPVVAAALKNKDIILSGIIIGVIGYAIGNFLGIGIAYFLRDFAY